MQALFKMLPLGLYPVIKFKFRIGFGVFDFGD